ncbi:predicted protein [Naegleria gruberi]|uniref:Predicted protein n=1 Tax=Naegleria gruberi TaxID=5762 RepID=D2V662_NAEGR|nr:uncharacterized protein NAEGRDRAFT_64322 [Naegleria gruberi]EFC47776.1 predicted protein [Naegleria gruberi]|eukprot:XP_002680520.1 predicted protein [Naegleria gruberi strain NEG-M]
MTKDNQHHNPTEDDTTLIKDYPTIRKEKLKFRKSLIKNARSQFLTFNLRCRLRKPLTDEAIIALKDYLDVEKNNFTTVMQTIVTIRGLVSTEKKNVLHMTSVIIDSGIANCILEFLNWDASKIASTIPTNQLDKFYMEVTWIISNIASGTTVHTQYIVSSGCIPNIVNILETHTNLLVKEQCVWALGNIAAESVTCRDLVLNLDVVPLIVDILTMEIGNISNNIELVRTVIWCLKNMLEKTPFPPKKTVAKAVPILTKLTVYSQDKEIIDDVVAALHTAFIILKPSGVADALKAQIE